MAKQVNMNIDEDTYKEIVKEAGKRMQATGKKCPLSIIVSEICMPVLEAYFNGHPYGDSVSPPDVETKSEVSDPFEELKW